MNNKNLPEEITIHNRLLNRMSGGKVMCKETLGDVQLYNCGIAEGQPVGTKEEDMEQSQPF